MAAGDALGCFGLTEPDAGSDPGSMRTRAVRDGSDWVLDGTKMWITNGPSPTWPGCGRDGVRGFVVPTGTPGFAAHEVQRKLSLRASLTAELVLDGVRLPADAAFPEVRGLSCLNEARYGILFGVVGAARACYQSALSYTLNREQYSKGSVIPTLLIGMSEPFVGLAHPGVSGVAFSGLPSVASYDSPPLHDQGPGAGDRGTPEQPLRPAHRTPDARAGRGVWHQPGRAVGLIPGRFRTRSPVHAPGQRVPRVPS